jgi:predicted DNA-binding protein with PD1-like motif
MNRSKLHSIRSLLLLLPSVACSTAPAPSPTVPSRIRAHTLRLRPGQGLVEELQAFAKSQRLRAGAILTTVGSLTRVNLRYANQKEGVAEEGHFEIVSLVGTLNEDSMHLHLSVSDGQGRTRGGHLLPGNTVYTTAEIVIAELEDASYERELDPTFGYRELVVKPRR